MNAIRTIFLYQLRDLARSKWLAAYGLFFFIASEGLLRYGGGDVRAMVSLSTIVLFVVPLVTAVYGTVYLYNSREFTELLLAQPVRRGQLYAGLYSGITLALSLGAIAGIAVPFIVHRAVLDASVRAMLLTLLGATAALTFVFTGLALLIAIRCEDRMRGLGAAIAIWLALALVYDGLVLVAVATFGDYPLERAMLGAMLLNPVDLARTLLLMQLDSSALMGYTGAVFQRFFAGTGAVIAAVALTVWIAIPALAGARAFRRKDF
ncbi:MAG TPA: ABC transporter permease subunit [Gemmatimonadaceae bacterium]|nr:ABC transporter permease subunit [Gemmatimonadaceae bacterium]